MGTLEHKFASLGFLVIVSQHAFECAFFGVFFLRERLSVDFSVSCPKNTEVNLAANYFLSKCHKECNKSSIFWS